MATNILTAYDDEDYIDIILNTYSPSHILCCSSSPRLSTNNNIEFEFKIPFDPILEEPTLIPADDLFHKGKLLPLYLFHGPPELEKEKHVDNDNDLYYSTTFLTCTKDQTLDHDDDDDDNDEHFIEWSACELNSIVDNKPSSKNTKSWINKLKIVLGRGMRTSIRAYLKSLFVCFEESCDVKKRTFSVRSLASSINKEVEKERIEGCTRCFSSVTKRCLSTSSSCSSSAFSSSSFGDKARFFGNSSDEEEEEEEEEVEMGGSVDAAVSYCKKSMMIFSSTLGEDFEDMFI